MLLVLSADTFALSLSPSIFCHFPRQRFYELVYFLFHFFLTLFNFSVFLQSSLSLLFLLFFLSNFALVLILLCSIVSPDLFCHYSSFFSRLYSYSLVYSNIFIHFTLTVSDEFLLLSIYYFHFSEMNKHPIHQQLANGHFKGQLLQFMCTKRSVTSH